MTENIINGVGRAGGNKYDFFKQFILHFIGYLIVGIPGYVLAFSILPHYVGFLGEPRPLHLSILQGFIWALLMALVMPLIRKWRGGQDK